MVSGGHFSWTLASQILPVAGPVMGLQPSVRQWTLVPFTGMSLVTHKEAFDPEKLGTKGCALGAQDCTRRFAVVQKLAALYTSMEYKPAVLLSYLGNGCVHSHGTGD